MVKAVQWTLEKIKAGLEKFKVAHGHYPTAHEIDACDYLPSSRQIQRRFHGLPAIREQLGLSGPRDFTKGDYSSARAHLINQRAHEIEAKVYKHLVERFGKIPVHREYFFTDDRRTRTDFFVYHKGGSFSVDVFHPKDKYNLLGCLNSKMRSYAKIPTMDYPVIFLMMNESISEEEIVKIMNNKKNKLARYQRIMTFAQFQEFCLTRGVLKL